METQLTTATADRGTDRHVGVAAGLNDTLRQAGVAVGIAGLCALIPAAHAFGGDPTEYVNGLHHALVAGGHLAAVGGWRAGS